MRFLFGFFLFLAFESHACIVPPRAHIGNWQTVLAKSSSISIIRFKVSDSGVMPVLVKNISGDFSGNFQIPKIAEGVAPLALNLHRNLDFWMGRVRSTFFAPDCTVYFAFDKNAEYLYIEGPSRVNYIEPFYSKDDLWYKAIISFVRTKKTPKIQLGVLLNNITVIKIEQCATSNDQYFSPARYSICSKKFKSYLLFRGSYGELGVPITDSTLDFSSQAGNLGFEVSRPSARMIEKLIVGATVTLR